MPDTKPDTAQGGGQGPKTRNWYAWNDLMPPRTDFVHVIAEVEVASPGVEVELVYRTPSALVRRKPPAST